MDYESLTKILSSNSTYIGVKQYLEAVQQQRMDVMKVCADVIINYLSDQQGPHYPKFLCLKFINELLELQEYEWIEITQKNILPILEDYAMFKKESKDDERGKMLFLQSTTSKKKYEQIKELEQVGLNFHRYTLESIWVWSKWFPIDTVAGKLSLYKIAQERLSIMNVKFPIISYFTFEKIINYQQIQRPPKEMLEECASVIKEHIQDGQKTDLPLVQSILTKTYYTQTKHNLQTTKTYPQIWKNALDLMKQGKLGIEISNKLKSTSIVQMERKLLQESKYLGKSRGAFSNQIFNFTQIISEKEKLLSEINAHIMEKEQINNQLFEQRQKNQELKQEIERLKQQVNQKQILNNQHTTNQFNQTTASSQQESLKEQDKLLLKRDLEIKKLSDINQHYEDVIKQLKNNINHLQQVHDLRDMEVFKLQQHKIDQELKFEEVQNQLITAQQQIKRQGETIKQFQQQLNQLNEQSLVNYEKQSNQIQKAQNDYAALGIINQQLKDENEQHKLEIELHKNEIENLKECLLKLSKQQEQVHQVPALKLSCNLLYLIRNFQQQA
ncbi:unnamed protein product (macronuclear) [Paramecium tetraurelia]|uniref:Uncharacterized protein n=1 Tax=Paramecium tetraurelia TaxID=5888 RepID=A0DT13_PARTE|nr:uncharacterized protein GSPATT00019873001 [Paramecium tetraurelia]CAK86180.1 unnamed protein product [Paramecium tetraurelia]|eukprot:XP_001453577.1 hypothetical protein (macronuclear) [Paramecium tetraurelia strain d4-2]